MIHTLELRGPQGARTVRFKEGLNLVYGERRVGSENQATCNSLGKSSFLWTIDFCLGANPDNGVNPKQGLPALYLDGWEFTLDFDLGGRRIRATRSVVDHKMVYLDGDVTGFPVQPTLTIEPNDETQSMRFGYDIESWKTLLGALLFDISPGGPTFRRVFSYFCRKNYDDALNPVAQILAEDLSRTLGYLFGLNVDCVNRFYSIKKTETDAKTLKKAFEIQLDDWQMTLPQLKRECREKGEQLRQSRERLDSFVVDLVYREKEQEANELTQKIAQAHGRLVANRRSLVAAKEDAETESVSVEELRRLYGESSVVFSPEMLRTLEETEAFHRSITANRQDVLSDEVRRLEAAIREDERSTQEMDERRAELLEHLSSCGALAEYTRLNENIAALGEDLSMKERELEIYEESNEKLEEAKRGETHVREELRQDFDNRTDAVYEADRIFSSITSALYNVPGSLTIQLKNTSQNLGYSFNPVNSGNGGVGVDKMTGFALDLTILLRQMAQGRKIDFLLHDGELFTSADMRQRKDALKLVDSWARRMGFQYITGMNYDVYPREALGDAINLDEITILKLHDASPDGKLYRFDFNQHSVRPRAEGSTAGQE